MWWNNSKNQDQSLIDVIIILSERTVVLKALRDMKEKGLLAKPSVAYQSNLAPLREDKVSVSYEVSVTIATR